MNKNCVRYLLAACLCVLCLLAARASAEVFKIPDGVRTIGERAFSGIGQVSGVYIPRSVTRVEDGAFSDDKLIIYGFPGSEAADYALRTNRAFVSIVIEDIQLSAPAWTAPDAKFSLSARAVCAIWPMQYRFIAEKNGAIIKDSGVSAAAGCDFTFEESGVYDLRVEISNGLYTESKLFTNAVTVGERVKFSSDALKVPVGQSIDLLSPEETRAVTITASDAKLLRVNGRYAAGLARGYATITARAVQPEGVVVTSAQIEVYIKVNSITLPGAPAKLFVGRSERLAPQIYPANATYPSVTWSSSDESVISVTDEGEVTALAQGDAIIYASADNVIIEHAMRAAIPVSDIQITSPFGANSLYTRTAMQLTANALPPEADDANVTWQSMNPAIATVNANGLVTGVTAGSTQILCVAVDQGGASATFDIEVLQGLDDIQLSTDKTHVYPGETAQIEAALAPANAADKTLVWTSSNSSIAGVDSTGRVTPYKAGVVTISATAINGVRAGITLRVLSFNAPTAFQVSPTTLYLNPGETYNMTYKVLPDGAEDAAVWLSSNPAIAKVDANGKVTAVSAGSAQVGVRSIANTSIYATCNITVLNPDRTLVMPARKTAISGISANKTKIANVQASAIAELTSLYQRGKLSSSKATARKNLIDEAFKMYSFPWMTLKTQAYWKAENSEGGVKDFQPGIVYYGLPYISNSYYNQRLYTVSKALSQNRYYLSDSGKYYILNQNKLYNGKYCGNDCSSMIAMCYFGVNASGIGDWNTNKFYTHSNFYTLSGYTDMYPGDILVRNWRHVVMFLYYANSARTQIVVIEQGGQEAGINTVSTSVYDLSYYKNNSYIPRRRSGW